MGLKRSLLRIFTWWNGETFGTQFFTARSGQKMGEDEQGNVYYRTADDKRRWVIYNGDIEASRIPAGWHGWLHRLYDETPNELPLIRKAWEKPHLPNLTGTVQAYAPAGSIRRTNPEVVSDYEAWSPQ